MKAISLWQPWATFMAMGWKKNETRHWATSYRGPLLIHAAKRRMTKSEFKAMRHVFDYRIGTQDNENINYGILYDLPYGAILCKVNLIDCQQIGEDNCPNKYSSDLSERMEFYLGNYNHGRFMWMTKDVETFEPIPWRGRQGLFEV